MSRIMQSICQLLKLGDNFSALDSWHHAALHIYNFIYPICCSVARYCMGVGELYFFGQSLSRMAANSGFSERHIMGVPTCETATHLITNLPVSEWFRPAFNKYGMYDFVK